jgi:peptidoglycan L-alanyl-D-glutamate endopeptidase CwlK
MSNKDKITLERIQLLHPKLREEVVIIYDEICSALTSGAFCRFSYTLRTFAEQDELYAQGRTKKGHIVTQAKGGLSMHNYGLALDIVIIDGADASWDEKKDWDGDGRPEWQEIVTIFKQHGWEWGGDWKFTDSPHFQKNFGYSVRDLLALYDAKKVDKNNYVLI